MSRFSSDAKVVAADSSGVNAQAAVQIQQPLPVSVVNLGLLMAAINAIHPQSLHPLYFNSLPMPATQIPDTQTSVTDTSLEKHSNEYDFCTVYDKLVIDIYNIDTLKDMYGEIDQVLLEDIQQRIAQLEPKEHIKLWRFVVDAKKYDETTRLFLANSFIKFGANLNAQYKNDTVLSVVVFEGNSIELVKLLVLNKADWSCVIRRNGGKGRGMMTFRIVDYFDHINGKPWPGRAGYTSQLKKYFRELKQNHSQVADTKDEVAFASDDGTDTCSIKTISACSYRDTPTVTRKRRYVEDEVSIASGADDDTASISTVSAYSDDRGPPVSRMAYDTKEITDSNGPTPAKKPRRENTEATAAPEQGNPTAVVKKELRIVLSKEQVEEVADVLRGKSNAKFNCARYAIDVKKALIEGVIPTNSTNSAPASQWTSRFCSIKKTITVKTEQGVQLQSDEVASAHVLLDTELFHDVILGGSFHENKNNSVNRIFIEGIDLIDDKSTAMHHSDYKRVAEDLQAKATAENSELIGTLLLFFAKQANKNFKKGYVGHYVPFRALPGEPPIFIDCMKQRPSQVFSDLTFAYTFEVEGAATVSKSIPFAKNCCYVLHAIFPRPKLQKAVAGQLLGWMGAAAAAPALEDLPTLEREDAKMSMTKGALS